MSSMCKHHFAYGFGIVWLRVVVDGRDALAVVVEDDVGGELMHSEVFLYGVLLGSWQVVVDEVLAREAVFGNGAAPCLRRASVAEV